MGAPVRRFPTTQWSIVFCAQGVKTPDAREALERLFAIYWYPVYAFIRSRTVQAADAEDLTQGFFTSLLGLHSLDAVRPEYGRFRAFLLASAKHYLAAERARDRTQKRGGDAVVLPLDFASADTRYRLETRDAHNPELTFERQWARATLDAVLEKLRQEFAEAGKALQFEAFRQYLTAGGQQVSYADVAAALEMSEPAVKVAVHRARRRFGYLLREQIAETVAAGKRAVHDEVQYLFRVLAE
jgi:RNA polymerase sigma-70 factor (ECF subfamily)